VIDAGFFETEVASIIRSYTYVRNYRNEFRMRWQDKTMGIAGLFIPWYTADSASLYCTR